CIPVGRRPTRAVPPAPTSIRPTPATRPADASLDHSSRAPCTYCHGARGHRQFSVDALDVAFNRVARQEKALGDFPIRKAVGHEAKNLAFALTERFALCDGVVRDRSRGGYVSAVIGPRRHLR